MVLIFAYTNIIIAFIISIIVFYSIGKKYIISFVVFIVISIFPYFDLLLQDNLRKFCDTFGLLNNQIYEYPQKNKQNKFESLSLGTVSYYSSISNIKDNDINNIKKEYENILKNNIKYLEFTLNQNNQTKIFQFFMNDEKVEYRILEKSEAKYIVESQLYNLMVANIEYFKVIDIQRNKELAQFSSFYRKKFDFLNIDGINTFRQFWYVAQFGKDNIDYSSSTISLYTIIKKVFKE